MVSTILADYSERHGHSSSTALERDVALATSTSVTFLSRGHPSQSDVDVTLRARPHPPSRVDSGSTNASQKDSEKQQAQIPSLSDLLDSHSSPPALHPLTRRLSIFTRRFAKVLAVFNTICFLGATVLQFSGVLDDCYCQSFTQDYMIVAQIKDHAAMDYPGQQATAKALRQMRNGFIVALALSAGFALIFTAWIYTFKRGVIQGAGRLWDRTLRTAGM